MTTMTDSEIETRGFKVLVEAFGEVNAERFITLTLREPQDYTKWREANMYLDGDLHAEAEKAREAGRRYKEKILFLFFHRRINLAILIITSIAISFLVGICVHFHEKTIWRQRLGYIYMGNSIVLSGILERISNEGVISYEDITNLENVVYSSTLIANYSDSKFTNDALWTNHLSNIGTYLQNHKREEDSPVIVELKKVLHNQLINH